MSLPKFECSCEHPDNEGYCLVCGAKFCGEEDTCKLNNGIYPPIIGCGKRIYKCLTCGGSIQ